MKNDNNEINFYTPDEIKKVIKNRYNERLVFINDGTDEVIGRFVDLPDIIVDLNRKFGSKDLKIYNFVEPEDEPIITTYGMFLNKISPEDREQIIDRLNKLQQCEEEIKDYKVIDIEDLIKCFRIFEEER